MVQTMITAPTTDKQIRKLVRSIRQRRAWIDGHEAKLDGMKEQLQALLTEQGVNWQDGIGYARLIPASTRTSYNTQQLDDLILRDPDFDCLRAYRRESKIRSSVQVK